MTFNSISFFIFLPVIFLIFFVVGDRFRWMVLLFGSYIFYGFSYKPPLLISLSLVILITYYFGRMIDRSQNVSIRRRAMWAGVSANLGILIYFKYVPFLFQNLNLLLNSLHFKNVLPVPALQVSTGLSFFIFSAISYLADIYFRMVLPEPHLGYFALHLAFFPKLLEGPIERAGDLLPQLKRKYEFNYDNMRSGMLLFSWGLYKKVCVADRISLYVDPIYKNVHDFTGLPLILATYAFAFQLYMDFSGYTDMAIGVAKLFNIDLRQNFNSPFLATSVADFWRRWHMTLSRWLFSYIFEPLQMAYRSAGRAGVIAALFVTFILAGIWHGASWNFVIFGFIHAVYLSAALIYKPIQKKIYQGLGIERARWVRVWKIFITFNLVCFSLVAFRAVNLADTVYVMTHFLKITRWDCVGYLLSQGGFNIAAIIIALLLYLIVSSCIIRLRATFLRKTLFRWMVYYGLVLFIILFTVKVKNTFIYFGF